MTVIPETRSAH